MVSRSIAPVITLYRQSPSEPITIATSPPKTGSGPNLLISSRTVLSRSFQAFGCHAVGRNNPNNWFRPEVNSLAKLASVFTTCVSQVWRNDQPTVSRRDPN